MAFGNRLNSPQPPKLWRLLLMLAVVVATIVWLQHYAALNRAQ
ncbi:MAG: hypothetical protein ACR2KS_04870 [Candidatus Eremiobacter antarcticus]